MAANVQVHTDKPVYQRGLFLGLLFCDYKREKLLVVVKNVLFCRLTRHEPASLMDSFQSMKNLEKPFFEP